MQDHFKSLGAVAWQAGEVVPPPSSFALPAPLKAASLQASHSIQVIAHFLQGPGTLIEGSRFLAKGFKISVVIGLTSDIPGMVPAV